MTSVQQPVRMNDANQFGALASPPADEAKGWSASKAGKDDIKQQMYSAKEGVKSKAADIQAQVVDTVSGSIQQAKQKVAQLSGKQDIAKKSNDELLDDASSSTQEGWQEVKRRGKKAIDENLNEDQKQKLQKGLGKAKAGYSQAERKMKGLLAPVLNQPYMRGVRNVVQRYNLELPLTIFAAIFTLWFSLTVIRLLTTRSKEPQLDIHSAEATKAWLRYHAGEYKDKAVDAKDSWAAKAAKLLSNYEMDKMYAKAAKGATELGGKAIDWKEIGIKKLGLHEPTMTEKLIAYVTGRPITWQDRVTSVLDDARAGITKVELLHKASNAKDSIKDILGLREPTFNEKLKYYMQHPSKIGHHMPTRSEALAADAKYRAGGVVDSVKDSILGGYEGVKGSLSEGYDSVRSVLPGGKEAVEEAKRKAYEAAHPSTIDQIKSTAEYVKNRIVHGAEEAAHRAEENAKLAKDKAKYHTGL